jgi:hypothetical protein
MLQKEALSKHSDQRGHVERGIAANRFRIDFGPQARHLPGDPVFLPQIAQDRRRSMRRITRSGRSY